MMDWDDFRFFQAVKRAGTLKNAAQTLGTDQATVGRRLYALEARLGIKLFEKRSNGYFLTPTGERISQSVNQIEEEFDGILRRVSGEEGKPKGLIRIAAPGALINHYLVPKLKGFLQRHPDITLQFLTGPEVVNLSKREADLAIRLVRPSQQNLQVKKIGSLSLSFYASKDFFKHHRLAKLESLNTHLPFIGLDEEAMSELEQNFLAPFKNHIKAVLRTHAWSTVFQAVLAGIGFGVLPDLIARQQPNLQKMKFGQSQASVIWLVTHPDLKGNARVKILSEELSSIFSSE